MPPKAADKKPASKAPATASKAPEKKDAGKKTAASGDKKKRTKTRKETYSSYIYRGMSLFPSLSALTVTNRLPESNAFPLQSWSRFTPTLVSPTVPCPSWTRLSTTFLSASPLRHPSWLPTTRSLPSHLARSRPRKSLVNTHLTWQRPLTETASAWSCPVSWQSTLCRKAPRPSPSTPLPRNKRWLLNLSFLFIYFAILFSPLRIWVCLAFGCHDEADRGNHSSESLMRYGRVCFFAFIYFQGAMFPRDHGVCGCTLPIPRFLIKLAHFTFDIKDVTIFGQQIHIYNFFFLTQ